MERRLFERPRPAQPRETRPLWRFRLFDEYFNPGAIKDFDGKTWGGVELGDASRDDFKHRFKTKGGHFVRAEALILNLPGDSPWDAQALTDGTKGDAVLTGFYLSFKGRGQRLDGVVAPDGPAEKRYAKQRYSDWYVAAYPQRGIALMVVNDDSPRVPYALLTTPSRLKRMLDPLVRNATPVSNITGQFDSLGRTVNVGDITADFSTRDIPISYKELTLAALQLRA